MSSDLSSLTTLSKLAVKEGRRRIILLSALFSVCALLGLVAALLVPKKYDASALLLIESNNIIKPLMEGRAVATSVADDTAVINQIVLGRKVMREVLQFGGWVKPPPARQPDAREEERLIQQLRSHIKIEVQRDELVHISFSDRDPQRTYKVANKLAEIYVRESQAGKERESREAFEFIDRQVKEYGKKLSTIHNEVLEQYAAQARGTTTAQPAGDDEEAPKPVKRVGAISAEQMAQLREEEALLEAQINRKPAVPVSPREDHDREEQLRQRVRHLQEQLDQMTTTFTDEHPDVKRTRRELAAARQELERQQRVAQDREASVQLASKMDDEVTAAAKARLADIRRRIAAGSGQPVRRPSGGTRTVAATSPETLDPTMRSALGADTQLSEMLRRYEETRDVYQDLLKRRDNARVSMELDAEHRGLTMRMQEPAELPASATGLRLWHLTLAALVFATAVPLGVLFLFIRFDRKVRDPRQIDRLVPLLGSVSYEPTRRERSMLHSRELKAAAMVAGVFVVYVAVFILKLKYS